eukprot:7671585-Heterocapsa_arctica.AAC.1
MVRVMRITRAVEPGCGMEAAARTAVCFTAGEGPLSRSSLSRPAALLGEESAPLSLRRLWSGA